MGPSDQERLVQTAPTVHCRRLLREPKTPEELLAHTCFNFSFTSPWNSWTFRRDGELVVVPVKCQASFTQGDLLRDLALAGSGIVRLAAFHVGGDIAAGTLVPLLQQYQVRMPELVHAHREHQSPRVKAFVEYVREHVDSGGWALSSKRM